MIRQNDIVNTLEEIDALPPRTIIAGDVAAARKSRHGEWLITGESGPISARRVATYDPPYVILFLPND